MPAKRSRLIAAALLGVAVVGLASSFWWGRRPGSARGEHFNVLLISIDTTRADHLGCYGDRRIATPNIDRLAAEGVLFEQCTAAAPITLPSHCSMLTGTYPYVHGARDNGQFHLHESNESLAEVLQAAGYATAAEVAAYVLNREFGMDQGFDIYNDTHVALERESDPSKQGFIERKAGEVIDSAIASLRANAGRPFFQFVHLFDPHQPFEAPPRFAGVYDLPYRAEIAYADEQIGRLLAELDQLGLADTTLVILTSDHGEGLGQHGEDTHAAFVYDTTLQVPLILRCPGRIPAGERVSAQVRTIDIAPTILAFIGKEPMSDAQGVSLLPLVRGDTDDLNLVAYAESLYPLYNFGFSPLRALRVGGWKYIHAPTAELYDVVEDPGEQNNLASSKPDRVSEMREELYALISEAPQVVDADLALREMTPRALEALQSLGYVAGGGANPPADKSELDLLEPIGPNPADHAEVIRLTARAMALIRAADYDGAETALRSLIERSPEQQRGFSWAHANLGGVLAAQKRFDEAIVHYRNALEARPDDARTLTNLGIALAVTGRTDEAIALYKQALRHPPIFAETHHNYAISLAVKGENDASIEQYERALDLEPNLGPAYGNMAKVFSRMGRLEEAVTAYERALALLPGQIRFREELAGLLLKLNRADRARAHFEELVRRDRDGPMAHFGLAESYKLLNRADEAIESYRRAVELEANLTTAWESLGYLLLTQKRRAEAAEALRSGLAAAPGNFSMANNLAWMLATSPDAELRDGAEAVRLGEMLRGQTDGKNPSALDTLAAAYAELGRFDDAVAAADRALELATQAKATDLSERIRKRRELYKQGLPFRDE